MSKRLDVLAFPCGLGLLAAAVPVQAGSTYLLLDRQGTSPDRVAVYADTFVRDRTPVSLDLTRRDPIKQIDIGLVYEALDKPYFTEMVVQFRCPTQFNDFSSVGKKKKKKGGPASAPVAQPIAMPQTVTFRLIDGFTRTKDAFQITKLTPSDWQTTSGTTMKRAYLLACNDEEIQKVAERTAYDAAGNFDPALFDSQMAVFGLTDTVQFAGILFMHDIAEMTWTKLWSDVKTPPINNGRDLTAEEIKVADAEIKAEVARQMDKLGVQKAKTMASLQQQQQEFKFREEAARLRGGRKMSRLESQMLMAWQDKGERDVVIAMGAPAVNEAAGVRFLSYGRDYDSRYVVQRVVSGQTWSEGVYSSCNIQFVLIPDAQAQFRVADVVVTAFRSGDGYSPRLCDELSEAPR